MNIIDMILTIWLITVGLFALFIIGESIVHKNPYTRFARWWRRNVASILDKDNEQF